MSDWAGKQLGQYEISAVIGKGGMATVYRARQASVGRDVAIKIMTEKADPDSPFMQRFEQEVRIRVERDVEELLNSQPDLFE